MTDRPYCPTCRSHYLAPEGEVTSPPYAVVHVTPAAHYHPITRAMMEPL